MEMSDHKSGLVERVKLHRPYIVYEPLCNGCRRDRANAVIIFGPTPCPYQTQTSVEVYHA